MQLFILLIRVIYERRRGMEIEEIYKVYINDVYRYLFSLSRSHHVAEDLMQETFYRAYLYLEDYENQKVKSWLFKVAYHTFIDFVRKEKKVTFVFEHYIAHSRNIYRERFSANSWYWSGVLSCRYDHKKQKPKICIVGM